MKFDTKAQTGWLKQLSYVCMLSGILSTVGIAISPTAGGKWQNYLVLEGILLLISLGGFVYFLTRRREMKASCLHFTDNQLWARSGRECLLCAYAEIKDVVILKRVIIINTFESAFHLRLTDYHRKTERNIIREQFVAIRKRLQQGQEVRTCETMSGLHTNGVKYLWN